MTLAGYITLHDILDCSRECKAKVRQEHVEEEKTKSWMGRNMSQVTVNSVTDGGGQGRF